MRAIILDTETTGLLVPGAPLEQQPKIIELAMLVVHEGEIVDRFEWLFNPGHPLDPQITKITGLTDADLAGKPDFATLHKAVAFVLMGADLIVAHNAPFDMGMLENEFKRVGIPTTAAWRGTVECTVQNYFHIFGRRPRLTELYEKILGKPLAQTHRAMDDCRALYEILIKDNFFADPQPTVTLKAQPDGPPIQLTTNCFTGDAPCPSTPANESSPPSLPSGKSLTAKRAKTSIAKKTSKKKSALKSKVKKKLRPSSAKPSVSRKRPK